MAIGFHILKPLASTSNAVIELSGIEKPSAVQCLFGGERKLLRALSCVWPPRRSIGEIQARCGEFNE